MSDLLCVVLAEIFRKHRGTAKSRADYRARGRGSKSGYLVTVRLTRRRLGVTYVSIPGGLFEATSVSADEMGGRIV